MSIQEKSKIFPSREDIVSYFHGSLRDNIASGRCCWTVMWLLVLLLVVWPLSLLAAIFYVLLTPFSACCECTDEITEFLHKGIVLPLTVATFLVSGRTCAGL